MKSKLLVIHTALAPYRVDFFNSLNTKFSLNLYFLNSNLWRRDYDQSALKDKLEAKVGYLTRGFNFRNRPIFRFGLFNILSRNKEGKLLLSEFSLISLYSIFLIKVFRLKISIIILSDDSPDYLFKATLLRKIARKICVSYIDGLIVSNKEVYNYYINQIPKISTIYFPIIQNEKFFKPYDHCIRVNDFLYVGRLSAEKNPIGLIKHFSRFNSKKKYSLTIVGDGPEYEIIKNEIIAQNQEDKIILKGWIEGEKLINIYAQSKILILPSLKDAFGAVVNEALLSGCLVLCSKFAGSKDLINHGRNGLIFDPKNSRDFNDKLEKILKLPNSLGSKMIMRYEDIESHLFTFLEEI